MKLAWCYSIVAQFILVMWLRICGSTGLWTQYLAWGICRSIFLLGVPEGIPYYWAWVATEPFNIFFFIRAIGREVERADAAWVFVGLMLGTCLCVWSVVLTTDEWTTMRRAALLGRQCSVFMGFGALCGARRGGHAIDLWILAYCALAALQVSASQWSPSKMWIRTVNEAHLLLMGSFFLGQVLYRSGTLLWRRTL